jgi:hypothetical protein
MDIEQILQALIAKSDIALYVLSALGSLVVLGAAYVKLTPSKADDDKLAKLEAMPVVGVLLQLLVKFSPIARKVEEKKEE